MPHVDVSVSCPVHESFRVKQVAGMFDVSLSERMSERFRVDIPELDDTWRVGLIVGPSGSGKSTIAKRLFGESLARVDEWPSDRAVIDGMGDRSIKEITGVFTAVGFSSPPSWIKPYHVLSGGERFRCDLARALLSVPIETTNDSPPPIVAFDEFTSVVDRNVARVASAAIAKGIHRGVIACRFVAVTCHYDIAEWLEPDWIVDMATCRFERRRLRRPTIRLEVFRCRNSAWELFKRHHYLSGSINPTCRCFLALWQGEPVAFCASLSLIGQKNYDRISRIVTLPDYQGIGIGMCLIETVARSRRQAGCRLGLTASHPAVVSHCKRSHRWRATSVKKTGSRRADHFVKNYRGSTGRAVVSFEYVGEF